MAIIQDGTGHGYEAEVNSNHQLQTRSIVRSEITGASEEGRGFVVLSRHTIVAANTEEALAVFTNASSTKTVFIDMLCVSSKGSLSTLYTYFDGEYTSGGSARTPLNSNRGSTVESGVEIYDNSTDDLVVSSDANFQFCEMVLNDASSNTLNVRYDAAIVLQPSQSMYFSCESGAIGDKLNLSIMYHESSEEI